jgi:hypothetical protein
VGLTKIGALWNGKSGSRAVYNGSVKIGGQKYKLLIFPNEDKQKDTQPDFRICTDMDDVKHVEPYRAAAPKPATPPPAVKPVIDDEEPLPF